MPQELKLTALGEKLRRACDEVLELPQLRPEFNDKGNLVRTWCNVGVHEICSRMGINDFSDEKGKGAICANAIVEWCVGDGSWMEVKTKDGKPDHEEANRLACNGVVVIAGKKQFPHGHVAVVYPGGMVKSGGWGAWVPRVANIGKDKEPRAAGLNWAFSVKESMPSYYCRKEDVGAV